MNLVLRHAIVDGILHICIIYLNCTYFIWSHGSDISGCPSKTLKLVEVFKSATIIAQHGQE
jgi:hypothetical protein